MQRGIVLRFISVLITVTMTTCGMSFAAEKKRAVKQEPIKTEGLPAKEEKEDHSTKPFDTKATALPPGYAGHNIIALYEGVSRAFPRKDEFESTEAYQKRLQGAYPQDTFAFVIETPRVIEASYDPDAQNMLVIIIAGNAKRFDPFDYDPQADEETVIRVTDIPIAAKEYDASNKFGARTVVTKLTVLRYGIGLVNEDSFRAGNKYPTIRNIGFRITPNEARDLKSNLGVLLVCRVRPGGDPPVHWFHSLSDKKPTMDSPTELLFSENFVNVDLFEIWVFNRRTGSIYAKEVIVPLPQDQDAG